MTRVEAYVPVLLNFRDNSLVYCADHVKLLKDTVLSTDNGIEKFTSGSDEFEHRLTPSYLRESLEAVPQEHARAPEVSRVEVYYYHHRIILRYLFDFAGALPEGDDRRIRELVLAHSRHVLVDKFVTTINSAGPDEGPLPDESGHVTTYYSYCLMILPGRAKFEKKIENLVGSHTFRIVEVTPKIHERDRVHVVRISIPSLNVYSDSEMRTFLRVDLLNAIYQHALYSKKEQDASAEKMSDLTEFSLADLDERNVMREKQLHALWDHAVDALGGRMVDLQGVHQQTLLFRVSIAAMVIAILGIALTFILA